MNMVFQQTCTNPCFFSFSHISTHTLTLWVCWIAAIERRGGGVIGESSSASVFTLWESRLKSPQWDSLQGKADSMHYQFSWFNLIPPQHNTCSSVRRTDLQESTICACAARPRWFAGKYLMAASAVKKGIFIDNRIRKFVLDCNKCLSSSLCPRQHMLQE